MSGGLSQLVDDLGELGNHDAIAMANSIRALLREVAAKPDRVAVAVACSDACHQLGRLILSIECAEMVADSERFIQGATASERRDIALADLAI